jgi:tetratricopeptide (TPR) repeat protein
MSLPKTLADDVAKNLVMVAQLIDDDPERAYGYSRVALRLASRVAAVREAAGFASYAMQKYAEALAEFRAARRMTGNVDLWPVMADCERGLGRPERALAMAGEPEVHKLDKAGQVEMRLVAAGARRDMDQLDAAIVTLQSPELASHTVHPWTARLRYAYADALLAAGREGEAREWFAKANEADKDGTTDASDRLAELDGIEFTDAMDDDEAMDDEVTEGGAEDGAADDDLEDDDLEDDDLDDDDLDDDLGSDLDDDEPEDDDEDDDEPEDDDEFDDVLDEEPGDEAVGEDEAVGDDDVLDDESDPQDSPAVDRDEPAGEADERAADGDASGREQG